MSDKPLGKLPKRKRKKIQINKTRYKKGGHHRFRKNPDSH